MEFQGETVRRCPAQCACLCVSVLEQPTPYTREPGAAERYGPAQHISSALERRRGQAGEGGGVDKEKGGKRNGENPLHVRKKRGERGKKNGRAVMIWWAAVLSPHFVELSKYLFCSRSPSLSPPRWWWSAYVGQERGERDWAVGVRHFIISLLLRSNWAKCFSRLKDSVEEGSDAARRERTERRLILMQDTEPNPEPSGEVLARRTANPETPFLH